MIVTAKKNFKNHASLIWNLETKYKIQQYLPLIWSDTKKEHQRAHRPMSSHAAMLLKSLLGDTFCVGFLWTHRVDPCGFTLRSHAHVTTHPAPPQSKHRRGHSAELGYCRSYRAPPRETSRFNTHLRGFQSSTTGPSSSPQAWSPGSCPKTLPTCSCSLPLLSHRHFPPDSCSTEHSFDVYFLNNLKLVILPKNCLKMKMCWNYRNNPKWKHVLFLVWITRISLLHTSDAIRNEETNSYTLEEILLTWEDHYLRVIDADLNKEVNACLLALNMANLPSGE